MRKMLAASDSDILRQKTSPKQDLTFSALFSILEGRGIHPKSTNEFYANYGLLNRDAEFNMNAYLLSDANVISLKVVIFEGTDKSVMSRRTEYGGRCLLVSVSEVMRFFETINVMSVDLKGAERKERPLFDYPSFREAWINACLHNDWNNAIAPSIYLFDDRLEIVSYGGLPFGLSEEGFYNGTSMPVNKSLLTVFMAAGYAEQSGHGVPTIVEKYGRGVFSFDDGMLKVSLPLAFERQEVAARKKILLQKRGLTVNQKKVYDALADDGRLSLQEVADRTGLSISGVKKICSKLREYGILTRNGSKRDGTWVVK